MPSTTTNPHPTVEEVRERARPTVPSVAPSPEIAFSHPIPEIMAALTDCLHAGLTVRATAEGPIWGWVDCATGARTMAVREDPPDPQRHASHLRVFLDGHCTHRVRAKRRTR